MIKKIYINLIKKLFDKFGPTNFTGLIWKSENEISISKDKAESLFKLLNILEENEDVQAVSSNFDVSDDVLGYFGSLAKGKLCLIKLGKKEKEM